MAVESSDIESAGVEGEEAAGGKRDMVLTACKEMGVGKSLSGNTGEQKREREGKRTLSMPGSRS